MSTPVEVMTLNQKPTDQDMIYTLTQAMSCTA